MRLKNKVAIITGSGNGIGRETAITFAKEGAKVVVCDFDEEAGKQTLDLINGNSEESVFIQANVIDQESVIRLMTKTFEQYGAIDILINNAGITRDGMLKKLDAKSWQQVIDVNLTGVFYCAQAATSYMVKQGKGKIINTSSVSGVYGNVGQTNYAATKAGVIGMTKTWAKELGRKGINVNAVVPGFIETRMVETVPKKVIQDLVEMVPLRRLGKAEDIAKAYLYLASEDADYVNGTVLHVDGGIVM